MLAIFIYYYIREYKKLTQDELIEKFHEENSDKKLLAVLYLLIYKKYGMRLYKEQIKGILEMLKGNFVEIKTGEGKTLVGLCFAIIKSKKERVFVLTVNDYLAKRDYKFAKDLLNTLNIGAGFNKPLHETNTVSSKKYVYDKKIIFSNFTEVAFDFLRNRLNPTEYDYNLQIESSTALLDEADFVLLDSSHSMFSISSQNNADFELLSQINKLCFMALKLIKTLDGVAVAHHLENYSEEDFEQYDYVVLSKNKDCFITQRGFEKLEKFFPNLLKYDNLYYCFLDSLYALFMFERDKDYIVEDNKILYINEETKRPMYNSKRGIILQTALELKEALTPSLKSFAEDSISYPVFFSKFKKIVGMSGTLMDAKTELSAYYKTNVVQIKKHFKNTRVELKNEYYINKLSKAQSLLKAIKENYEDKKIIVFAKDEKEVVDLYNLITQNNYNAETITAKNIEEEDEIIKASHHSDSVLVTTAMLGRGVDIIPQNKEVFIISFNRYLNIRTEKQIKGRAGRNGYRGYSLFLSSLEDDEYKVLTYKARKKANDKLFIKCQEKYYLDIVAKRADVYDKSFFFETVKMGLCKNLDKKYHSHINLNWELFMDKFKKRYLLYRTLSTEDEKIAISKALDEELKCFYEYLEREVK